MSETGITFLDLIPDTLQGWQEHEEAMDRIAEAREARLENACACVWTDVDQVDARGCPEHSTEDLTGDARQNAAYYAADVPAFHEQVKKPPAQQMSFRFNRRSA